MASIKVKFRPSTVEGKEGTIYYQVIHERKIRQVLTSYKIMPSEWSVRRSLPVCPTSQERSAAVVLIIERIRLDVDRMYRIMRRFEAVGADYDADDLVEEFRRYSQEYTLVNFMGRVIIALKQCGRMRTAETYASAVSSFRKFLARRGGEYSCYMGEDIMLDAVSSEVVESYEAYLRDTGVSLNTVSFYMRILRAAYNRAVETGIIEQRNPFRRVYTGVEKTVKRALPVQMLSRIKHLELSAAPDTDMARDMFMLSFYLRGMSFVDMAFLRKSDLKDGYVSYRRRKTGQTLRIAWTRDMQAILDKYPANPTQYLLPIIAGACHSELRAYRNAGCRINHCLKKVGRMAGVTIPLTMYCARHSWASAAKSKGIPLSVISEGMGHDSETTTQIYLASLSTSAVDRANALIISSL